MIYKNNMSLFIPGVTTSAQDWCVPSGKSGGSSSKTRSSGTYDPGTGLLKPSCSSIKGNNHKSYITEWILKCFVKQMVTISKWMCFVIILIFFLAVLVFPLSIIPL